MVTNSQSTSRQGLEVALYAEDHVRDPLYGEIRVPRYLAKLLSCWELQRLRYVRLINVNSLSLPSLGDTYRYSHTLGVIWLGTRTLNKAGILVDSPTGRLLLCALALHDIGTPAFGHSLEYVLRASHGRDHVDASIEALSGTSRPRRASDGVDGGARDHAWRGSTGADHRQLRHELRRILGRDFASLLTEALRGNGIIGRLVSSPEIDLDNIDNVFRMAAALGVHNTWSRDTPLRLATAFPLAKIEVRSVAFESAVPDKSLTEDSIREWLATRKEVYRVLNLHPVNLAGLAMLRELFDEYALVRPLSRSLWWTTDDDALKNLALEHTESLARRIRVGDLYSTLVVLHIDTVDSQLQALEAIVGQLRMFSCALENIIDCRVRVHAILDNGTFERPISIAIFDESSTGSVGLRSRSIIISVHGKSSRHRPPAEVSVREKTIQLLAAWFKVSEQRLRGALAPSEGAAEEYLHEAIQIKMPFDQ